MPAALPVQVAVWFRLGHGMRNHSDMRLGGLYVADVVSVLALLVAVFAVWTLRRARYRDREAAAARSLKPWLAEITRLLDTIWDSRAEHARWIAEVDRNRSVTDRDRVRAGVRAAAESAVSERMSATAATTKAVVPPPVAAPEVVQAKHAKATGVDVNALDSDTPARGVTTVPADESAPVTGSIAVQVGRHSAARAVAQLAMSEVSLAAAARREAGLNAELVELAGEFREASAQVAGTSLGNSAYRVERCLAAVLADRDEDIAESLSAHEEAKAAVMQAQQACLLAIERAEG